MIGKSKEFSNINGYSRDEVYKATLEYFKGDTLATDVWINKYALKDSYGNIYELTPDDMHKRIAKELYRIESKYPNPISENDIYDKLKDFKYIIPGGSSMAGIGNEGQITSLSNCFVIGTNEKTDSYGVIMRTDEEIVQLSKRRGGVGTDLSHIRPGGSVVKNAALTSTGIVPFMERYSNTIREVGQCIEENQRILTKNGLIKIKDCKIDDYVWTKKGWVRVNNILSNKKTVYEIKTKFGFKISTSKEHIFLTTDNFNTKEQKLGDFKIGDPIILLNGTNINKDYIGLTNNNFQKSTFKSSNQFGSYDKIVECKHDLIMIPEILDEKLAYILGFSYGDGCVENKKGVLNNIRIACEHKRPELKNKLLNYIKDIFGYDAKVCGGDGALDRICVGNMELCSFLFENELLKEKSGEIKIPGKIFNSSTSVQAAFLSGLFDADGYASGSKRGYVFSTISEDLKSDIQTLLMSMGILSKVHIEKRENGWKDLYSVVVIGALNQRKFVEMFTESIKVNEKKYISRRDFYKSPYSAKSLNIKYNDYSYISGDGFLSINTLNKYYGGNIETLTQDYIESITEKEEVITKDLCLDDEHLFWCEGFYVHNSGRRGALLLSISSKHPEAEQFMDAKLGEGKITGANISLKLDDEFMESVIGNGEYIQQFPVNTDIPKITKKIDSRKLFDKLIHNAWKSAEPGCLFWDTIIRESIPDCYDDLGFKTISTNPCGEITLCDSDSCRLLAINLYSYVDNPFTINSKFNYDKFEKDVVIAQRFMDDIVDLEIEKIDKILDKINSDSESEDIKRNEKNLWLRIKDKCVRGRRTGLGITGEGDMLAALGITYGTKDGTEFSSNIHKILAINAYKSSCIMGKERGEFPIFDYEREINNPMIKRLSEANSELGDMLKVGRRNIALLTIAPTGTISILTKTTSGIEPVFLPIYKRRRKINGDSENSNINFIDENGDKWEEYIVIHQKFLKWMKVNGYDIDDVKTYSEEQLSELVSKSPYHNATSNDVDWVEKVRMQGCIQKWVDHSISVTVNLPSNTTEDIVRDVYISAWTNGCKGITVYRDGSRSGVLVSNKKEEKTVNEILKDTTAVKRPEKLECDVLRFHNNYNKWIGFTGILDGRPYEIFTGLEESFPIPTYVKGGWIKKIKNKGDEIGRYDFIYLDKDGYEQTIIGLNRAFKEEYWNYAKLISGILRHGMPIPNVVNLVKSLNIDSDGSINTWINGVGRMLKSYIKDGTEATGMVCPECGSNKLNYQDGCVSCSCGWSKCS